MQNDNKPQNSFYKKPEEDIIPGKVIFNGYDIEVKDYPSIFNLPGLGNADSTCELGFKQHFAEKEYIHLKFV